MFRALWTGYRLSPFPWRFPVDVQGFVDRIQAFSLSLEVSS